MTRTIRAFASVLALAANPYAVVAQSPVAPAAGPAIDLQPILAARARAEFVEQGAMAAEAVTLRVRAGAEARAGAVSVLAEGETTLALTTGYNAFPFAAPGLSQWRPKHAVIPDPENAELNRLQIEYRTPAAAVTIGRQRIELDDQRWVGSVGWRQNEQTFDAVRATAKLGPAAFDVSYAIAQRTIFGSEGQPRTALDGNFVLGEFSLGKGAVTAKAFAYLLDYDEPFAFANSSQTYGGSLRAKLPVGGAPPVGLRATFARQSDHASNPFDYAADYWSVAASGSLARLDIAAEFETLGSDNGRGVQTPLATLHKFNGWADLFLTTPPAGLQDLNLTLSYKFLQLKAPSDLTATVRLHRFRSARGAIAYGHEFDAAVGAHFGKISALLKYAGYRAQGFGVDTDKFWLQLEFTM